MRTWLSRLWILSALSLFWGTGALADPAAMSRDEKAAVVASLSSSLQANYVFPDIAAKIAPALQAHLSAGDYDAARTQAEFAARLTDDLVKISGDLHFSVGVDADWVAEYRAQTDPVRKAQIRQAEITRLEASNFGFDEVRRLDGNIGYIRFSYFADPALAYDKAASVMQFVGDSDAVIIDLRYNNGGYLEMAQFMASYFFPSDKDQLLFDYNYKEDGQQIKRGQWVLPGLPGKRMVDKPVYILTGSTSFSSAEWLSYAMQKLGRAVLIGERTAGGAHPVTRKPIDDAFFLQVPIGQIRDPIDHGDFEGVGVQPDMPIASIRALPLAHKLALEALAQSDAARQDDYAWMLPALMAAIEPPVVDDAMLRKLVGRYEGRQIVLENGTLFYIWRERFRAALQPIAPNLFAVEGVSDFRYRLNAQPGQPVMLERVNRDGSVQSYAHLD